MQPTTRPRGLESAPLHGVALALELRKQYLAGGELTMTQNPWVTSVDAKSRSRYQIQQRRGLWQVSQFGAGSAASSELLTTQSTQTTNRTAIPPRTCSLIEFRPPAVEIRGGWGRAQRAPSG